MSLAWHLFLCAALFIHSTHGKGCVQLDTKSFQKVTSKFYASLIKFDTAYPYGNKHDQFEEVCDSTSSVSELLVGEVQVKDYGEKDNEDLARKYGVFDKVYPVVLLFINGQETPLKFSYKSDDEFTAAALRRFIRENTELYLELPGSLQEYDILAGKFIKSKSLDERKTILAEAESLQSKAKDEDGKKSAKVYIQMMKKVIEKGDEFIGHEMDRLQNIVKKPLAKNKEEEMRKKINILAAFGPHDEL